ncbi:MAG: hypothetical protein IPJ76_08125 [Flavobacteriales bacterium]|nr:MAG: hypothetical protein IPJ76_08125 [Flavobacteriales bacterium]
MKWTRGALPHLPGLALAMVLFGVGMYSFPLAVMGPGRELLPGDLGDSRFNNYILEHFHQYVTGRTPSYWDAPFMYPYKNVIAFSDNLLGSAPVYSLFRGLGFNRESSYQLWILAMFALNFLCCFAALWAWTKRVVPAACGAYVFAFGIHFIGHMDHAQMFPRFMVPLAFWWCWQWLRTGKPVHLALTTGAIVFQFYCGIYLGFILCYVMFFLVIGHQLVHWRGLSALWSWSPRTVWRSLLVLVAGGLAMLPLMTPYLAISKVTGVRGYEHIANTIPRPSSWFFTHPAAVNWQSLSSHSKDAFPDWWSHFHFMGAVAWAAVIAAVVLALRGNDRKPVAALIVALGLSLLFCLRMGDLSLYKLIAGLPGFSALRAIDRFVPVLAVYFAALVAVVAAHVKVKPLTGAVLGVLLCVSTVLDNKVNVAELKQYNKHAAREMVERAALDMHLMADSPTSAIAYTPVRGMQPFREDHERSIAIHLTAMLAGQELGIPVVNAYTGHYPGNHMRFWDLQTPRSLAEWCAFNQTTTDEITIVNNAHQRVLLTDTLQLRAANGHWVCVDLQQDPRVLASRDTAMQWETLVRLRLANGRVALVAHNDAFMSVQLHKDSGLVATSARLGDMGMFLWNDLGDGSMALRADNGLYLELDTADLRLYARAAKPEGLALFRTR